MTKLGRMHALSAAVAFGVLVTAVQAPGLAYAAEDDKKTLRAVSLLYRHGVISPKYNLPNAKVDWPMGFMQLTAIGMRGMYERGQKLRKKYVDELGLISPRYQSNEVFVRSSGTDRALQTAQMLVLGLYPLGTGPDPSVYNASLKATPAPEQAFTAVPIRSVALQNDRVLRPWTGQANCKKYRSFVKSFPKTRLYKAMAEKHADFLRHISKATGVGKGKSLAHILYSVNEIYEPISSMIFHGKPLPEGITKADVKMMSDLADWNYHHQFLGTQVGRLTGGSFLEEVIENFKNYTLLREKGRRFFLYSGHQRTLLGVDAALGIETARTDGELYAGRVPPLGSHYAFEFHEVASNDFAVKVKFVTDDSEKTLKIPGCDSEMCGYDQFKKAVSAVIPENWVQECAAG